MRDNCLRLLEKKWTVESYSTYPPSIQSELFDIALENSSFGHNFLQTYNQCVCSLRRRLLDPHLHQLPGDREHDKITYPRRRSSIPDFGKAGVVSPMRVNTIWRFLILPMIRSILTVLLSQGGNKRSSK
jgi:hypothetical protein